MLTSPFSTVTSDSTPHTVVNTPAAGGTIQNDLKRMQELYVYKSPDTLPGVAFVEGPATRYNQGPCKEWLGQVVKTSLKVLANIGKTHPSILFTALKTLLWSLLTNNNTEERIDHALKIYGENVNEYADAKVEELKESFASAGHGGNFEENNPILHPFREMWPKLERPDLADVFMEDKMFARLRVAGYNPMSLTRVFKREDMPFEITDKDLPWQRDNVDTMIQEERLYMQDFSALMRIAQDTNETDKRFVSTAALYGVQAGGGDLEAIGIRCDGRICIRPKAGAGMSEIGFWSIAKMAVNQNDGMHHEVIAHLSGTHLLMEPFVIATMRQLHHTHPLHRLLCAHFEGTLHINDRATSNLIKDGGNVDKIFAGDISSVREFVVDHVLNTHFNSRMPHVEMKQRGVTSSMLNMPYRDDALEHYEALRQWARDYLSYYYPCDTAVAEDVQLQQWAQELTDEARGRVKGFGEDNQGKLTTVKYLVDMVAFLMFTASVQHAAVNFPQFGMMSYSPAVPGALYGPIPEAGKEVGVRDWCALLTPMKRSLEQIVILSVIGNIYHTQLGQYGDDVLPNEAHVSEGLKTYQGRLKSLESRIVNREKNMRVPYTYLLPSKVPQSINI